MPSFVEVQFPTDISFGAKGGPTFSTIVIATASGAEQRIGMWSVGRHRWDVSHALKTPTQADALKAFFVARQGKLYGFRFKDWTDYTATAQALTPDAKPTIQLIKTYASGGVTYTRTITKPVAASVTMTRNGLAYSTFTFSTTTGIVTHTALKSKSITNISKEASAVVTVGASHGFLNGEQIYFSGVVGMTQINGLVGTITATGASTITVNINSSAFTTYTSGGTAAMYPQTTDTLAWTGQFDVPVRFDTDVMDLEAQDQSVRSWSGVPVVEILV